MLSDDRDWLSGSDVVSGRPIINTTAVKVFLDNLLSARESVAATHRKDYRRSDERNRVASLAPTEAQGG